MFTDKLSLTKLIELERKYDTLTTVAYKHDVHDPENFDDTVPISLLRAWKLKNQADHNLLIEMEKLGFFKEQEMK